MWHGYFLIELIGALKSGLTQRQSDLLKTAFPVGLSGIVETGKLTSVYPHERLQIRTRLDNKALIAEATWATEPTKNDVVQVLVSTLGLAGATELGVAQKNLLTTINSGLSYKIFSDQEEALNYLVLNTKDWDG